jgi:WD40 repeat protein
MKHLFYLLICMGVFVIAKAQKPNKKNNHVISNYQQAIRQGDSALIEGNYPFAINKYFAAEAYEPSRNDEVKLKIDTVFYRIIKLKEDALKDRNHALDLQKSLKKQFAKAENARIAAEQQKDTTLQLSISMLLNTMATESVNEDPTFALRMTDAARRISPQFKILDNTANKIYEQNAFYKKIGSHDSSVRSVAFSPDGNTILTGSGDSIAHLWNLYGDSIKEFKGHNMMGISSVAFSKDGKNILTGSQNGTAVLWDKEANPVHVFKQKGAINAIALSPGRNQVLIGSSDTTIASLWSPDGKFIREFKGHKGRIYGVAFSTTGDTILTCSSDGTARMWKLNVDTAIRIFKHQDTVYAVAFSPTRNQILTGSFDKIARLWNLENENEEPREFKGHIKKIRSVAFSKTGDNVLTGSYDNTARLWNLQGKTIKEFKGHKNGINTVAFSPVDDDRIITGSEDGTARIWYFTEKTTFPDFKNSGESITSLAIAGRGDSVIIVTGSSDGIARLRYLNGDSIKEFTLPVYNADFIIFSPAGNAFLTVSNDSIFRLWQLNGEMISEFIKSTGVAINFVAFSPNGNNILAGYADSTSVLWNVNGDLIRGFKNDFDINYVAFSPDGKKVMTGLNGTVNLWDLGSNNKHQFNDDVFSFDFSLTERKIILGSRNGTVQIWEWDLDGKLKQVLEKHTDEIFDVAFSPGGNNFLTVSLNNNKAVLWNLKGEILNTFEDVNYYYAFSPDGKKIATVSADGTAHLWWLDGKLIADFKGHSGKINSIKFSPARTADSASISKILTASEDGTARLWKQNGELVQEFGKRPYSAINSAEFSPDGKTILTSAYVTKQLWRLDGSMIREFKNLSTGILSVAYCGQTKNILTGYDDGTVGLWDMQGKMKKYGDHSSAVTTVAFSPTGDVMFTASSDTTIVLRDLVKDSIIKTFKDHSAAVNALAVSPFGDKIFSGSDDSTAILRNLKTGDTVKFVGHYAPVTSVAFSPSGDTLLTGCADGTARMWDTTGIMIQEIFVSYSSTVKSVAFSHDGKTILTGSADGMTRLLDLYGTPINQFPNEYEFTGEVNAAVFLPKPGTILTASADGIARFWSLAGRRDIFDAYDIIDNKIELLNETQVNQLLNFIYGEDFVKASSKYGEKEAGKYAKRKNIETITSSELSKFLNQLLNLK